MLAAQDSRVAAFVSLAGAGEPAAAILRRQLRGRLTPELTPRNEAVLTALEAGKPLPDVPPPLALAPELVRTMTAFLTRSMRSGGNADPLE